MSYWGYHYMAEYAACNYEKITNKENVIAFTKELVSAIDMIAYGEPQVINFGTGNKAGFTLIQLIETSNIAAHFCNETGDVYLDVFSCKNFDKNIVNYIFNKYFQSKAYNARFLERQAPKI